MKVMLLSLTVLNFIDALVTTFVITAGIAIEANPIMAVAWAIHPLVFWVAKLGVVSAACWLLWHARDVPLARITAVVLMFVYLATVMYSCLLWVG